MNNDTYGPIINKECPCKDCAERHEACHTACDKYIGWRKLLDRNKHTRWLEEQRYVISKTKERWLIQKMKKDRK